MICSLTRTGAYYDGNNWAFVKMLFVIIQIL